MTRWPCRREGATWKVGPAARVPLPEGIPWFLDSDGTFLRTNRPSGIEISSNATDVLRLNGSRGFFPMARSSARGWCFGTGPTNAALFDEQRNEARFFLPLPNVIGATFITASDVLVTASRDGVRAWRTDSGRMAWHWQERIEPVIYGFSALAGAPDGKLLVVALDRLRLAFLDASTGEVLARLSHPQPQPIVSLTFSPDGSQLAAACPSHVIQLWDLRQLRRDLAALGLDWNHPSLPPPPPTSTEPMRVVLVP